MRTEHVQGPRDALGCLDQAGQGPGGEDGFGLGGRLSQAVVNVRGCPETQQQRRAYIKQHPCGNERQDDRMGRAY